MSLAVLGRSISIVAVALALASAAVAQPASGKSGAKLGVPSIAAPSTQPLADPGTMFCLSSTAPAGSMFRFVIVGDPRGGIWGDGIYSSDSVLATAAVHAGLLQPGETGIVSVEVLDGLSSYEAAERNGVASRSYGAWDKSYRLTGVERLDGDVALPDPGSLAEFRGRDGAVLRFQVTGDATGSVWGDGIYTDDSILAAAAVHAGVLEAGETGVVTVEILPGQSSYEAAERHGVISTAYQSWDGSYRILPPLGSKVTGKLAN